MPKADQFAIGLALIAASLAVLLSSRILAFGALFLGLFLVCNAYVQDYFWGADRPTQREIKKMTADEYQERLNPKFERWVNHVQKPKTVKWELLIPTAIILVSIGAAL